ncbi:MAG TPA: AtpZ/AtpI family protein [Candidatus Acidoferrum sp.]|jgi:ATP synthase protein I
MPSDNNESRDPSLPPAVEKAKNVSQQFAMATELPFVLVGTIAVGGGIGYFLDAWLHTKPILMIVLGFLGFFAGLREVLRRLPK